jgi:hypothetical protein
MSATNHAPVIIKVEEREGYMSGIFVMHEDISFMDADGDAVLVLNKLISSTQPATTVLDDKIQIPAEHQKRGSVLTSTFGCSLPGEVVIEFRVLDKAGNLSEPVRSTIICPATAASQTTTSAQHGNNSSFLIGCLVAGLGLLVVGVLVRSRYSLLLLLFAFTQQSLLISILHEGGHALWNLLSRGTVTRFVVHPFSFSGYVRPIVDSSIWTNFSGPLVGISVALLIFIISWKRRSVSNLPLLMLFPFGAILEAINILNAVLFENGDYYRLMLITGLPAAVFMVIALLLVVLGIILSVTLFPLLGLAPEKKKTIFVVPAGLFLWSVLGTSVAYLVVPLTRIMQDDSMAIDIAKAANTVPILELVLGLILALVYITLYRRVYPRLPAGLRTETINLTWNNLRIPGLLAAISVMLGLVIII